MDERIFSLKAFAVFSPDRASITEVVITTHASIAVWGVKSGQTVAAHWHPEGQDTWVMLEGSLTYFLGNGRRQTLSEGQVAIATPGQIHGAINESEADAIFVSIYSAPQIGFMPATP
jgi:quercetin dioxygenase-like cupin family protein